AAAAAPERLRARSRRGRSRIAATRHDDHAAAARRRPLVHALAGPRSGLGRPRRDRALLRVRPRGRPGPRRLPAAGRDRPPTRRGDTMRHVLAAVLAVVALGCLSASAGGTTRAAAGYRILLVSDRDGVKRAYSMRPDGSGLAPLLPHGRALLPIELSGDSGTIAWLDKRGAIYVSQASGAGLRRLTVRSGGGGVALSHDGRRLAFSNEKGIWIVGTDGGR